MDGTALPAPRALLYRLLRSALLLSVHDVTTRLYDRFDVLPLAVRREVEIANVAAERTVTRWELMDAEVGRVLPGLSQADVAVGDWVLDGDGRGTPEVLDRGRARGALAAAPDLLYRPAGAPLRRASRPVLVPARRLADGLFRPPA